MRTQIVYVAAIYGSCNLNLQTMKTVPTRAWTIIVVMVLLCSGEAVILKMTDAGITWSNGGSHLHSFWKVFDKF